MWSSGGCGMRQGYETSPEPCQEVHAREAAPLAVGGEQLVGLLGLDPASPQGGGELCEAAVAVEAVLVAPEPLGADDAERPRAEPALAHEARDHLVGRVRLQAFEVQAPAEADERARAARA